MRNIQVEKNVRALCICVHAKKTKKKKKDEKDASTVR